MRLPRLHLYWKVFLWIVPMGALLLITPQGRYATIFTKHQILNTIEWAKLGANHVRPPSTEAWKPPRIAHAGGGQNGQTGLNDKEALEAAFAQGFQLFELDFEWTSDQELVAIHDWEETWERFGGMRGKPPTLAGFMQQMARRTRTGLDLTKLSDWMTSHPDSIIITDVKSQNITALSLIVNRVPKARQRVIPQAYSFEEWDPLVDMGFERVLLTVYKRAQRSFMLRTFITKRHPWGLTLPKDRASHDSIVQFARDHGVHVFAHTVNTSEEAQNLIKLGVSEIYTDFLLPVDKPEPAREQILFHR